MISPLIPWNVGGAFVAGTLGIETLVYAPFVFACWLAPLFDLLWAATGFFVPKASEEEQQRWKDLQEEIRLPDEDECIVGGVNITEMKRL